MIITLPEHKKLKILKLCTKFSRPGKFIIRELAAFIGVLVSSLPAVQFGSLFYRYLESCKIEALRLSCGNFDSHCSLTNERE